MNIFDVYADQAEQLGSAPAISYTAGPHAGTVLGWADLVGRAHELAARLWPGGRDPGRVALVVADHPDVLPALLAVWSRGGVVVVLDPQWGAATRESVLRHSGAGSLLTVDDGTVTSTDLRGTSVHRPDAPAMAPGTAVLAYTSGSTSAPKGIALQHARVLDGMIAAACALESYRGGPPGRLGSSMRLSGFGVLVLHFLWSAVQGTHVVVLPRLDVSTAGRYWSDVEEHGIDLAVLVSPLFELLLRTSRIREGGTPPLFLNSSGPITETAHRRFGEQFGGRILNCYGLTEASFAITIGDTSVPGVTTRSIGRPFALRVRLETPGGGVVSGPGEGELQIHGPSMSEGYYDNPAANAGLMSGRWMRTGDLARRDEHGRYLIVGRLKDAVMKGGQTVYLTEVEEAATAVPEVLEAVAVRLDIGGGNEDIGLLARASPGKALDTDTLSRALQDRLGRERAPRRVVVVTDPLPRIGQDKLDRRGALARWAELTGRGR